MNMLLDEPATIAIWALLIVLTVPAVLLLGSPHGLQNPRQALRDIIDEVRERAEQRRLRLVEAMSAARYADEIREVSHRAGHAAERWQEHLEQTELRRAAAWEAWLGADARLRRSLGAAAFGTPWTPRTPREYADRERFLHKTVAAAAERGELPAAAIADARHGRNGWNPRLHPMEQETAVHRASAAHLRAVYDRALAEELTAAHDARLAASTRDSLRLEAAAAAVTAASLHHLLPAADAATARPGSRRAATLARAA